MLSAKTVAILSSLPPLRLPSGQVICMISWMCPDIWRCFRYWIKGYSNELPQLRSDVVLVLDVCFFVNIVSADALVPTGTRATADTILINTKPVGIRNSADTLLTCWYLYDVLWVSWYTEILCTTVTLVGAGRNENTGNLVCFWHLTWWLQSCSSVLVSDHSLHLGNIYFKWSFPFYSSLWDK